MLFPKVKAGKYALILISVAVAAYYAGNAVAEGINDRTTVLCEQGEVKVAVPKVRFTAALEEKGPTVGDVLTRYAPNMSANDFVSANNIKLTDVFKPAPGGFICLNITSGTGLKGKTVGPTPPGSKAGNKPISAGDMSKTAYDIGGHGATRDKMVSAARKVGFTEKEANTLQAIMMAESRGNPKARCFNIAGHCVPNWVPGVTSVDRGYLQFNSVHKNISDKCAEDIDCSAREAYKLYKSRGNSFRDWVTYQHGTYRKWLL